MIVMLHLVELKSNPPPRPIELHSFRFAVSSVFISNDQPSREQGIDRGLHCLEIVKLDSANRPLLVSDKFQHAALFFRQRFRFACHAHGATTPGGGSTVTTITPPPNAS